MKTLKWKSSFFSNKTKIYSGDELVGAIETNFLNNKTFARLNDTRLNLRRSKFFNEQFEITQNGENGRSGVIKGKLFSEKYEIQFGENKDMIVVPKNFWKSRWILQVDGQKSIEFNGGLSGSVAIDEDVEEAHILAALFCMIQNNLSSIIIVIVVVIIIAS